MLSRRLSRPRGSLHLTFSIDGLVTWSANWFCDKNLPDDVTKLSAVVAFEQNRFAANSLEGKKDLRSWNKNATPV